MLESVIKIHNIGRMTDSPQTTKSSGAPDGFTDFEVGAGFVDHIGPIYWKLEKDSCELGFRVLEHHLNPGGICHGGLMMTVVDMAIGFSVCWNCRLLSFAPSINNNFDFIRAGHLGDWMQTETELIQKTKRMGFARGLLKGPNGPVMRYNGILKIPSDSDPRFNSDQFAEHMQRIFDRYK